MPINYRPPVELFPGAAGCQRGRLRFRRAAVNASPGPPHLDTSSANPHPSSQLTPNWMRAVPADQLPDQDRPRTWWGSGSWPAWRWQRSYPPNCARITSWQRAGSPRLSCSLGTWVMGVSLSCLSFSACCHRNRVVSHRHAATATGSFLIRRPGYHPRSGGLDWSGRLPQARAVPATGRCVPPLRRIVRSGGPPRPAGP